MKNRFFFFVCGFALASMIAMAGVSAKENSSFAKKIPNFSLKDPVGKAFTNKDLSKDGLVLVVTAPILKNKSAQEGWSDQLMKAKGSSKAKLVLLEDMQPSAFKGKAKNEMEKEYEPGKEPILLIDNSGETRKDLKVPEKETVVLVYDNDGKLVYSETGKPSTDAAKKIWEKVKD
jgi:hypothetical protein